MNLYAPTKARVVPSESDAGAASRLRTESKLGYLRLKLEGMTNCQARVDDRILALLAAQGGSEVDPQVATTGRPSGGPVHAP
jgi:redox-sensitive bicupin YhaK (pirin superfamily)